MDSGEPATIGDGRYAIDRRIGVGGCGAVYLCYDTVLNRWVAIKRVEPDGGISDPFREARQLASLQHQNIVMVYDFFRTDGDVFVVMEYVAGQNLNELTEPMDVEFFTAFAKQTLEGLAAAHAIGMVHRDIKPANIMLAGTPSGGFQTKLLDFGLAKVMSEPSQQTMDHAGAITGSIHTISPEQLSRQPMDHRADLYSLGCVFYKALTMRFPFHGDDVPSLIAAHLQHDFPPLADLRPDLPPGLASWVEKLFAFNQDERPQSAAEALLNLDRPAQNPSSTKRPVTSGKPLFATQPPAKKTSTPPPANSAPPASSDKIPFYRSQNFVIAMVAVIAVCATISILALTGNFGGGGARPTPIAKKEKPAPTPAERTAFKSTERGEIKDMAGKKIDVTGTIERLEQDLQQDARKPPIKGYFLLFKDSDPTRDLMVFFDPKKTEVGKYTLAKKFLGKKVRASGTVSLVDGILLLEMSSPNDLELTGEDPAPAN